MLKVQSLNLFMHNTRKHHVLIILMDLNQIIHQTIINLNLCFIYHLQVSICAIFILSLHGSPISFLFYKSLQSLYFAANITNYIRCRKFSLQACSLYFLYDSRQVSALCLKIFLLIHPIFFTERRLIYEHSYRIKAAMGKQNGLPDGMPWHVYRYR